MKKIFVSFVASLSLATAVFGQGIVTIVTIPGKSTNSIATNNLVFEQKAYPATRPPMSVAQTEPAPVQYEVQQPQPPVYVQQPQPQVVIVQAAPPQMIQPHYVQSYQGYDGVVVTPAGRPVEQIGDWVPYGGWSYGSNRRSSGGQINYRSQVIDRRSGPVDVLYTGQSYTVSRTISVPSGYGNSGATVVNGSGRRSVPLAPARIHYAAPPRVHYYTAPKVHVPAY